MDTKRSVVPFIRTTLAFALFLHGGGCYKYFQDLIPNGEQVPHPCRTNYIWRGVGHQNPAGGGARNPFGLDFHANGKKWDRKLCMLDSDGDGKLNGQELGDADCVWKPGRPRPGSSTYHTQVRAGRDLSHQGVCDPWNSPDCKDDTTWVSCEDDSFNCPAVREPDVLNVTIRIPETPVPAEETTYMCMIFELPTDADYHMIAHQPYIDNEYVMHHTLLYGCDPGKTFSHPVGVPYNCGMEVEPSCMDLIGTWSFGMTGECAHEKMGFRVGNKGYKHGAYQIHWNNPQRRTDYTDSSGMVIHLTTKLRENDGGVLTVGQEYLDIPPGEQSITYTATCSSQCTNYFIKNPVQITTAFNHMHYLGRSQKVELFRNDKKIHDIAYDAVFDYDSPVLHIYKEPLTFLPGDEIKTMCEYKSTSRQTTTFYGDGTYDEMCYAFITFFPKQNIPIPWCGSWKSFTDCAFNTTDIINGCEFKQVFNVSNPSTKAVHDRVLNNCSPLMGCRKECLPVVKEVAKDDCYHGEINDWARMNIEEYSDNPLQMLKFYAALDSCKDELAKEMLAHKSSDVTTPRSTNTGVRVTDMSVHLVLVQMALLLFGLFH